MTQPVWTHCLERLRCCDLTSLQCYTAWCRLQGRPWNELGPNLLTKRDRTAIYAGLTGQRYAAQSARGLDHLLPPGLGKEEHIAASLVLPSPFSPRDWPEEDVAFVLGGIRVWRGAFPRWAQRLRRALKVVAQALVPLDDALNRWRSSSSSKVAMAKRPGLLTALAVLIRWPDLDQGQQLLKGYPIVGDISPSGVFRPVTTSACPSLEEWLTDADQVVDRLVRSPPGRFAPEILTATQEEIDKGFCGPLLPRESFDPFGRGRWRPMERFLIKQPDGKLRVIDNCHKTLHNMHTAMRETITTVHLDFIAAVGAQFLRVLQVHGAPSSEGSFSWLRCRVGADDLPDAYRGLPVLEDHQRLPLLQSTQEGNGDSRSSMVWHTAWNRPCCHLIGFLN